MSAPAYSSNSHEASHYVVTAHPPGAVLLSVKCNFLSTESTDVVIAKSARLEVRQMRLDSDVDGTDTFPVVLQLPINGRLTALCPLSVPSLPTTAIFMLQDRYQYAVISYTSKPPIIPTPPGQRPKVSAYPVYTHSSGSLETANISRPNEGGTIVAVDPYYRCIAIHAFDGLLTIIPVDLNYQPPSNAKSDDNSIRTNPRRPKQLLGTPFHCRVEESTILSITFMRTSAPLGSQEPPPIQIAVLHQDSRGLQHLTTHVVNLQKQQIYLHGSQSAPPSVQWMKKSTIDGGSSMLIPVKLPIVATSTASATAETNVTAPNTIPPKNSPAVVVIGQRQFTYCSATTTKIMPVPQSLFLAYTELPNDPVSDMPRYLLADEFGTLHILSFVTVNDRVVAMQLEALGSTTLASTLTYLNDGLVFVGSTFGDSQLIQIHDDPIVQHSNTSDDTANNPDQEGGEVLMDTTYLSVIDEYTNLGPILDFDLVPTAPQSGPSTRLVQSQVVTASGTSKSGSIRIIRNGIGMYEHASVDIPGIQAMWSLRRTYDTPDDTYLVQSFVGQTRVLGVTTTALDEVMTDTNDADDVNAEEGNVGGALEEVIIPGLVSTSSTLYVGNIQDGNRLLQITSTEIRLFEWSGEIISTWTSQITIATANEAGQIAVSLQGGMLVYLVVEGNAIRKMSEKQLDSEVSSLDIHPFHGGNDAVNATMEIDDATTTNKRSFKSLLVAVGLWDDFTVRLLSVENSLKEVVCINLGCTDDEEEMDDELANTLLRQNRNNMMARSLCLVSLDFTSASTSGTNVSNNKGREQGSSVNMLFVGMGDGTLVSFAVVNVENTVSVQSKKEVCIGTQRIDLVRLSTEHGGTCVLATGDRPTVIYLAGIVGSGTQVTPKLCYSNVNVEPGHDDHSDQVGTFLGKHGISVNVATPFFSPLLFKNLLLGKQQYSLCVADNSQLKLGVIDDIQKLHVTTCHLGMAPRRIVHCPEGRLYAVGCIESGIHNFGFSGDEANMGNCIRFLEETSFDDLDKINLEPFEMILSMIYVALAIPPSSTGTTRTEKSSSTNNTLLFKPFLLVGTAYAFPDEDEPTRGRILIYSCQPEDSSAATNMNERPIRLVTELLTEGGVYSMCQFYNGRILVTVNSKTHVCQLVEEVGLLQLQYVGLGHFGHILSLFVKSRAQHKSEHEGKSDFVNDVQLPSSTSGENSSEKETKNAEEMLAIVGDLMRSISLVQFYPEHNTLEEIARDFNANWTCAVEMLNENIYLGAENWNNLFCLRRNTASSNEEMRCRLDTIGEFHLGEMCNKFMSGSLVMPVSSKSATSSHRQVRRSGSPHKISNTSKQPSSKSNMSVQANKPIVSTGSQTLFGTVDGTIGVILGLDSRTAAFFASLERAMATMIRPVGDFSHQHYRACHAERRMHPAHGFVDGDLTEAFLDMDRNNMEVIVQEMNRDGGWDIDDIHLQRRSGAAERGVNSDNSLNDDMEVQRYTLTVEDVLAMVEEMTMMH